MSDKLICRCKGVSEGVIIEAVKGGATTLEAVGRISNAATGCGSCEATVERIIKENK
jgi:NAD(P)H-nitrite reductase large subunit